MTGTKASTRVIQVKVKPGAKVSLLEVANSDGIWRVQVKSPPVDGKANEELIALVAKHFARPKSAVSIKSGAVGRIKGAQIEGL